MSRTVWKYEVLINDDVHRVLMPRDAVILHVNVQTGPFHVYFWAEIDPAASSVRRYFKVHGTGQEIPEGMVHVGTAVTSSGLVWHLYEVV